jgi:hypothetical protein
MVFHQSPPSIQIEPLENTGHWELVGQIVDEVGADARLKFAVQNPRYSFIANNCEHFAFYVATGTRQSPQLQQGVAIVGLLAVVVLAFGNREAA